MHPTLTYLEQIRYNLRFDDYETIYQSILALQPKFVPTSLIKEGHFIERARINYNGEVFTRQDQVSYISDPQVIAAKVSFGRANLPKHSVFYGSIISPEIQLPRAVTYFETSSRIKKLSQPGPFVETFTVSGWRIKNTFQVTEIIYGEDYKGKSEYVKLALENQAKNLNNEIARLEKQTGVNYRDLFESQARLFCTEFSKTAIDTPDDYKISAALSNYFFTLTSLKGITYPSVPSEYQGQNVALTTETVDQLLILEKVYQCKCVRFNNESPLTSVTDMVSDFGANNSDFHWLRAS
jgi:hypothetical protein